MVEVRRPVLFCGENPAMSLYEPESGRLVAAASYWRCTYSPLGSGQALILWLATPPPALPAGGAILSDNPALARMLAETLTQHFPEFREVPVIALPHVEARLELGWDGAQMYRVNCHSAAATITAEWGDLRDHKQIIWPAFPAGAQAFDLTTVICPCYQARILIAGAPVAGTVQTGNDEQGWPTSSAFLAFAETWIGPVARP